MAKRLVFITARASLLCQPLSMFNGEIVTHYPNYTPVSVEPRQAAPGEDTFALLVEEDELHEERGSLRLWVGPTIARKNPKAHVRCTVFSMKTLASLNGPVPQAPGPIEDLRSILAEATDAALIAIPYVGEGNLATVKAWINDEAASDGG